MIALYVTAALLLLIFTFPYLRCLAKRLVLVCRLRRCCRRAGAEICPVHRLWFLGGKRGDACDFYVVTASEVYAVKLFGLPRRRVILILTERGDWRIRSFIAHTAHFASVCFPIEGKPHPMPQYDFHHRYREAWEGRTHRRILLVHPVAMDFHYLPEHGEEAIIGAGDTVGDLEVFSLPHLLSNLERL